MFLEEVLDCLDVVVGGLLDGLHALGVLELEPRASERLERLDGGRVEGLEESECRLGSCRQRGRTVVEGLNEREGWLGSCRRRDRTAASKLQGSEGGLAGYRQRDPNARPAVMESEASTGSPARRRRKAGRSESRTEGGVS